MLLSETKGQDILVQRSARLLSLTNLVLALKALERLYQGAYHVMLRLYGYVSKPKFALVLWSELTRRNFLATDDLLMGKTFNILIFHPFIKLVGERKDKNLLIYWQTVLSLTSLKSSHCVLYFMLGIGG